MTGFGHDQGRSVRAIRSGLIALAGLFLVAPSAAAVDLSIASLTQYPAPMDTNGDSYGAGSISHDGRFALFFSEADNLGPPDANRATDLFLHDNSNGTVERVNLGNGFEEANADTLLTAGLSDDGRYIAFESRATNLVSANTHGYWQIYLRDRVARTTILVSRGTDGGGAPSGGYRPQASADGRYVVFVTNDALLPQDVNTFDDVYRYDRVSDALELVSVTPDGEAANWYSNEARISADGRYVAFLSMATNLFPDDSNFAADIVLRDMITGSNVNASIAPGGGQFGGERAFASGNAVSADGRYVLFNTDRALELTDNNFSTDGFQFDRMTNQSVRVTRGPGGAQLQFGATASALSADGNTILMESTGADLAAFTTPGYRRSYARDLTSGVVSLLKLRPGNFRPDDETRRCALSGNGSIAYCDSYGRNLVDIDGNAFNDVFRYVIGDDSGQRVSRPVPTPSQGTNGDSDGLIAGASADGRYVVFESTATNLVVDDNNGIADVFLRDLLSFTTVRLSVMNDGTESTCASHAPRITPDARFVVFESCGALVAPASGTISQIYRYDRLTAHLELVSTETGSTPGNAASREPSISADGNIVAFTSTATNLGVTPPPFGGVFVRNLANGGMTLANRPNGGATADGGPVQAQVSGDGRWVYFSDSSTNLVAGDTNGVIDVFAYDRDLAQVHRRSLDGNGQELPNPSLFVGVSNDGGRFLFETGGAVCTTNRGLHVRDVASGQIECVSLDGATFSSYQPGYSAAISADGNRVAFTAFLMQPPHPSPTLEAVLVHDRTTHRVHRITPPETNRHARVLHFCADGDCVLFSSRANNIVPHDPNNHFSDIFIARRPIDDTLFRDGFEIPQLEVEGKRGVARFPPRTCSPHRSPTTRSLPPDLRRLTARGCAPSRHASVPQAPTRRPAIGLGT